MKNLKKYLIEFAVIVVGVLTALALENWNENRKRASLQIDHLKALQEDITFNIQALEEKVEADSIILERNQYLIDLLVDPKSQFHDSLGQFFRTSYTYWGFNPKSIAYEALKNEGMDLITNAQLLAQLTELYDLRYWEAKHMIELSQAQFLDSRPIFLARFRQNPNSGYAIPLNFDKLKSDDLFLNWLSAATWTRRWYLTKTREFVAVSENVRILLATEISKME